VWEILFSSNGIEEAGNLLRDLSQQHPTTAVIEELINELRQNYTIIIVTHSMQQAARVSEKTAYFHLGSLIEHGETTQVFTNPANEQTEAYISGKIG